MKEKTIQFFKHDRSYSGGVKLYNEICLMVSLKKQLNVQEENDYLKLTLFEALRDQAGIPMGEFQAILRPPVVSSVSDAPEKPEPKKTAAPRKRSTSNKPASPKKRAVPKKPATRKPVA